jgi:hypothetical protein
MLSSEYLPVSVRLELPSRTGSNASRLPRPIIGPAQLCGHVAGSVLLLRNITVALTLKREITFAIELIVNVLRISILPRAQARNSRELLKSRFGRPMTKLKRSKKWKFSRQINFSLGEV